METKTNKIMVDLNLTINTSIFKKYIKNKIDSENITISKKDKINKIGISTSYIPIAIFTEYLIDYLIKNTMENNDNDFNGLTEIKFIKLENLIYKDKEIRKNFIHYLYEYNSKENYKANGLINFKIINQYISKKISKSLKLDNDYMNFLCFVLNKSINQIINISVNILQFTKKTYIKSDIIKFVISILYNGEFYDKIETKLIDCLEYRKEKKTTEQKQQEEQDKQENNENQEEQENREEQEEQEEQEDINIIDSEEDD